MYYCELCNYKTKSRNKIHSHHIVPRELCGTNNKYNRIFVCPTCHHLIFIPNAICGHHSIKAENSVIIIGKKLSSDGILLNYINEDGIELYTKLKN